jgi:hypothetical protein
VRWAGLSGADRSICDELRVSQNVRMLEGLNIAVGLLGVIATLFSTLVGFRQMRYQGRTLAPAAPPAPDQPPAHQAPAVEVPPVAGRRRRRSPGRWFPRAHGA